MNLTNEQKHRTILELQTMSNAELIEVFDDSIFSQLLTNKQKLDERKKKMELYTNIDNGRKELDRLAGRGYPL